MVLTEVVASIHQEVFVDRTRGKRKLFLKKDVL